ncbi:MAG: NADPH-dependent 7-cyano-7-deazaguanine reductase QueF, partial [Calditrichaeota bacterium]
PKKMRVVGEFTVRGGMRSVVKATYEREKDA